MPHNPNAPYPPPGIGGQPSRWQGFIALVMVVVTPPLVFTVVYVLAHFVEKYW